jgi:dTDP-4-amino-4,6-dideoxygalactose transaminase
MGVGGSPAIRAMKEIRIPWAKPYVGSEEVSLVKATVNSGWLTQGPRVSELEERAGTLTGCEHVVWRLIPGPRR